MQITIIAVGRMQRGPEQEMLDTYLGRLPWKSQVIEIDIKKQSANSAERKSREAEKILASIPHGAAVIALDERGKSLSSREFAGKIDAFQSQAFNNIAFIIGGADGLDETIRKRANLKVAFGTLTWPHMMVRVMIAEQTYRAWSILAGHPYHRD